MIELRCHRVPWDDSIEFAALERRDDGSRAVAEPLTMRSLQPGELIRPTLSMGNQQAQQLMDELWRCGLRPTEGTGSAGSLAATERHLKDMQRIAMGLLKQHGVSP